jgi:hypothetical protein
MEAQHASFCWLAAWDFFWNLAFAIWRLFQLRMTVFIDWR